MPSTEAQKRLLRAMHSEGLFEDELLAEVVREAALNQHLDECEGRCMCGARGHEGDCHFGWHRDGCPDAPKVKMDDYMAGHRQGASDERARLRERVEGLPMTFGLHTCWDNHEGGVDANGNPTLHADGSSCGDRIIGESVSRAAVLAILESTDDD